MKITWGGVAVGTGTNYQITGVHNWSQDYESLSLSFDVLVQNTTLSTFLSECATLEAAYRTKNSDLTIVLGGSNHTAVTHAADTGFNGRAEIVKAGSLGDSNASRIYTCSVVVSLPADETGKNSRQDSGYELTSDEAGIQTLNVNAIYTATGGTSAFTQAQSQFPAYAAALQPAGDWDSATGIIYRPDDEDKVCECLISYREIIHNQSQSGANDASLVGEEITVSVNRTSSASDKFSGAAALVEIQLQFNSAVLASSTTDLIGKWETLRAYLLNVAQTQSGVTGLTVVQEAPELSPSGNRLAGTISFIGSDGSNLLRSETITSCSETSGETFVRVANGSRFGADIHQGPASKTAIIQTTILELDTATAGSSAGFKVFDDAVRRAKGKGFRVTETRAPLDRRFEHTGFLFSSRLSLRIRQRMVMLEYIEEGKGKVVARRAQQGGHSTTRGASGASGTGSDCVFL